MRRLRRVGVRQQPQARFPRAALASAAVGPHGRGSERPRPRCNATRHGSAASCMPGVSPIAAWPQESTRQPPRRLPRLSPHRIRCDPTCLRRGVCPRDTAISAVAALDCALRRPRRRQPTTLPVAALWMAASVPRRHESLTRRVVSKPLAAAGPKAAFAACHYPFSAFRTPSPAG